MSTIADFAPKRSAGRISNVPSKLIRQVVTDVKWVLSRKRFRLEMWNWCETNGHCSVCLAGSVIVRRVARSRLQTSQLEPSEIGKRDANLIHGINYLRETYVDDFLAACVDAGHRMSETEIDTFVAGLNQKLWGFDGHAYLGGSPTRKDTLAWCDHAVKLADQLEAIGH